MKSPQVIQTIALLSLAVVAAGSIYSAFSRPIGGPLEHILQPLFGIGIWGLLLWKIWKRPRQWGLGVGIFLLLMIAFQTFLFHLALAHPAPPIQGITWTTFFLLYESPILIAGMSCILLRIYYPRPVEE